jgi:hypothetical protein
VQAAGGRKKRGRFMETSWRNPRIAAMQDATRPAPPRCKVPRSHASTFFHVLDSEENRALARVVIRTYLKADAFPTKEVL